MQNFFTMIKGQLPFLAGVFSALFAISVFSFALSDSRMTESEGRRKHKIVFHITTPDTTAYRALIRQLNNIRAVWPDAQVEVVAHSKGIHLLEKNKSNVPTEVGALKKSGIRFYACEQTLKQMNLTKADILPEVDYVERGIVHIVERQEQGWSYIKGGF